MTLYTRLALVVVILALTMGIVAGFVVGNMMRAELQDENERLAVAVARGIAREVAGAMSAGDTAAVRTMLEQDVAEVEELVLAYVVGADGGILAHSPGSDLPEQLAEDEQRPPAAGEHLVQRYRLGSRPILLLSYPLGAETGAHVHVGLDESSVSAGAEQVRARIVLIALLAALVAGVLLVAVAGRMTLPVRRVVEAMRAFGSGEGTELVAPPGGGMEIEQLVAAFNAMTGARRRAEAELRASEERFSQVFSESPMGIIVFGAAGEVLEANPAALKILGLGEPGELAAADLFTLLRLTESQVQRVRAGERVHFEVEMDFDAEPPAAPEGSQRSGRGFLQVSVGPLGPDDGGGPPSYLALMQDVTEEVRALEDLHQARERAEQYLEVAGVMLLALDPEGRISLINRWGCEILGYPEAQILGREWFGNFLPERVRAEVRRLHDGIIAGERGEMVVGENPVLCADGSERLIAWRNSLLRDARGEIIGTLSSGEDVTEHRRAEQELRQSERRFRTLVESMGDGLIMVDTAGRLTYANQATREMLGYEEEEWKDAQISDYLEGENRAVFAEQWRRRMQEHEAGHYQIRITAASGRQVPVLVTATPLRDAAGRITGSLAVLKDITEHAEAVQALRDSEERYRALADSLPQIIFETDAQGRLTFTNRYATELLGYELGAPTGPSSAVEMIAPHDRRRALAQLRRILEGEEIGPTEYDIIAGDGRVFPAVVHVSAVEQVGRVVGVRGVIFDVSNLKRAEAEIHRLNQFRENVIDSADVWLSVTDAEGRVMVWNRAAERISGYRREETVGAADVWERLIPDPAERESMFELAERALRGEAVEQAVSWLRRRDGEERIIEWSARRMSGIPGEPPAIIALGRDVTDSRRLRDQLERAERMDAVGRLAGGIAHDFNNLLSAIMGHLGMLLRGLEEGHPQRLHAEQIDAAVRQASTMTRQLLAFSRREPLMTQLEPIDINQVVEELGGLVQPLLSRKIDLVLQLAPEACRVRADTGELQQLLMNLIINARDAMPGGGRLGITTRGTQVAGTWLEERLGCEAERCMLISVSDSGEGMDEQTRSHIFDPFFTTKPNGEGTGLGLSTVYRVVQNLGGTIEVSSEVGEGTVFDIYLPCCGEADDEAEGAPGLIDDEALRGGETVLVAEDEDVLRDLCRVMLDEFGYRPLVAPDAERALAIAREHRGEIDILVTDILMPGMSGVQLADHIQDLIPGLPVLYISGYAGGIVVQGERFDPGDAFVQKPFTLDDLLLAMRQMLDR